MVPVLHSRAHEVGLTANELRNRQFVQPAAGISILAAQLRDLDVVCSAVAQVLPDDAVFTHVTSAQLRSWWLPAMELPIVACTDSNGAHLERRGVYVRRCAIPDIHRERLRGLAVASSAWTIVELAEHLALMDLVVVIDSALQKGDVTIRAIRDAMVRGRRGVRMLRRALALCDGRSESAWETVLRLLHVLAGIDVEPQYLITDATGDPIARSDLMIKRTKRLPEYDGAHHRDRAQHERDLRREKRLARMGYERYGYTASEILREPDRIIRDAEDALGLSRDPTRLRLWLAEMTASSFSAPGRAALTRRLHRFVRMDVPRHR